jgi:hypothetical protein
VRRRMSLINPIVSSRHYVAPMLRCICFKAVVWGQDTISPILPTLAPQQPSSHSGTPTCCRRIRRTFDMSLRYSVAGPSTTCARARKRGEIYQHRNYPSMPSADSCTRNCWWDGDYELNASMAVPTDVYTCQVWYGHMQSVLVLLELTYIDRLVKSRAWALNLQ